jgi:hypothetical protein
MPQLTQLELQQQLSAAALVQLPSQLVELQLSGPDCDGAELKSHLGALLHLQTLKLAYGASSTMRAQMLNHAATWRELTTLRHLSVATCGAVQSVQVLSGIAATTNLTKGGLLLRH